VIKVLRASLDNRESKVPRVSKVSKVLKEP
jgi:hypothetical protein